MADLASLVVRMQADNSQYVKALDQATQKLQKFQKDQQSLFADMAKQLAAAFTIDRVLAFASGAIEAQASLQKFSQEAGVSVETLSGLSLAAAASGLSTDELGVAFKKLNTNISEAAGDGTSKAATAFKLLGISVTDANGNLKDAGTVNNEIADAFAHSEDGANKAALAVQLFGRQGVQMIPTLDKGSAGLKQLADDAAAYGAVLSGDAAKAAEEFQAKLNALEAGVKGGLQNAIAGNLVPALLAMADAFGNASEKGEAIKVLGDAIATGIKIAATIVLEAAREFTLLGSAIGGAAAAAVAAAHGEFSQAASILQQQRADALAIDQKFTKAEAALWDDAAQAQIKAAQKGAEGAAGAKDPSKTNLGSLEGAQKAVEGLKSLQDFSAGLQKQAASFGLGSEAATRFALANGKLADDLKAAHGGLADTAAAADKAAASAIAAAKAFQFKVDTKAVTELTKGLQEQVDKLDQSDVAAFKYKITTGELGDTINRLGPGAEAARAHLTDLNNALIDDKDTKALGAINDKLDEMSGKLQNAAAHAFDLQNKTLTQNLTARGDTAGLATVQNLKDKEVAQAAYNEQVQKGAQIQADFAAVEAQISAKQASGSITDLQAQSQLNDARQTEVQQLGQVLTAEQQIADSSGIQKLADQTKSFATQIVNLNTQTNLLEKQVRDGLESAFANNFSDLITGAKSFRDALTGFLKDIEKQFADMVSKNFAQQLFGTGGAAGGAPGFLAGLFGGGSGGGGSSGGGFLAGLFGKSGGGGGGANVAQSTDYTGLDPEMFGGGFAAGGTLSSGQWGMVGENGPELAYAGSSNLHIQPMGAGGGQKITNHFAITSPTGTISRQSQMQVAAQAARSLGRANSRNNR